MKADYTINSRAWLTVIDGDNRQMKANYTMYESVEKK